MMIPIPVFLDFLTTYFNQLKYIVCGINQVILQVNASQWLIP